MTDDLKQRRAIMFSTSCVNERNFKQVFTKHIKDELCKFCTFGSVDFILYENKKRIATGKSEFNVFAEKGSYEVKFK